MLLWIKPLVIATLVTNLMMGNALAQSSSEENSIPPKYEQREDIPESYKWRLEDIYASEEAWEKDLLKVQKLAGKLEQMEGQIGKSVESLKKGLDLYIEVSRTFEKTYAYAKLAFHTNKSNSEYQRLSSEADDAAVLVSETLSFLIPELQAIPKDQLNRFVDQPALADYRRWILDQVSEKDHTLTKELEELLAKSEVLAGTPENVFGMLSKDMIFPAVKDETGKDVSLTPANYSAFMKKEHRAVRKNAYEAYYKTIDQFKDTFAQILSAEIKKNIFYTRVRNYPSTREASLEANHIPIDVYDNLIQTVHQRLPDLHRYISLKKKVSGLSEMHLYDMYVNMAKKQNKQQYIPYEEAQEMVKKGLAPLGPEYAKLLDKGFKERWVDVYYTAGKRTGAYQWGVYDTHPFILLNYHGDMGDVYTLAHEFGHAAHSHFSKKNQTYLNASYPIFTAEVASTTNEALLFQEMYDKAESTEEKIAILSQRLEDYMGTLFLQTMFAEFEKEIHENVEKGEALTAGRLNQIYGDLLQTYFGEDLKVDHYATLGWARIPHFYRNYYVYQYATGFAAANAFAEQIKESGEPAVERYVEKFLSAGNSKDPLDVLKEAGVDMSSPQVIDKAMKGFTEGLDELEKLLEEAE